MMSLIHIFSVSQSFSPDVGEANPNGSDQQSVWATDTYTQFRGQKGKLLHPLIPVKL